MTDAPLLQICPNDRPPFRDICQGYQAAAATIGRKLVTIFLSATYAEPMAGALYLDCPTLKRTGPVAKALTAELKRVLGVPSAVTLPLVICHRYRAYRAFRASGFSSNPTLVVAHEFGLFQRRRRRLDQRLFARRVRFAGVSAPVVDELARVVADPLSLPNGIDAQQMRARAVDRVEALATLGLNGESFNIGVVGRLHPKKQPQLAMQGLAALTELVPSAHLVFIGDGELEESLRAQARSLQAQGLSVSFAGFVADAVACFAALDVVLITSGQREAFSMVALEAMAMGTPVVAGPTPGPHFVLADVGHYFDNFTGADVAAALAAVHHANAAHHGQEGAQNLAQNGAQGVRRAEQEFSLQALGRRLQALL
jgi:glycosyltransferase involved in cell wall biosynthesis